MSKICKTGGTCGTICAICDKPYEYIEDYGCPKDKKSGKRMSKMDIHNIREMQKEGMSQKDIAYVMECSPSTISLILNGKRGEEIDRLADRTEYFLGGISSGNYENGEEMVEFTDPTMETVAFEEQMELFLAELEANAKD